MGCQVCLTEIMTSEIQKNSANKLVVKSVELHTEALDIAILDIF